MMGWYGGFAGMGGLGGFGIIFGMPSVNAYSGQVWYHNWHGALVQITEARE